MLRALAFGISNEFVKQGFMKINDRIEISNIIKTDLHMHTMYCDGHDSPEEMVVAAISKGMECIGFSGHSYVPFDEACGMNPAEERAYRLEISRLKVKYQDKIKIYCGIEQDYCSEPAEGFDYIIGSVHYLETSAGFIAIDDTPEIFRDMVKKHFDGDYYAAAERYFDAVSDVVKKTNADIIGHFDLICKFNEKEQLFDEHNARYVSAWKKAADRLLQENKLFEINTGAISRNWRTVPYPAPEIFQYIKKNGGKFILSGDSHACQNIAFGFEKAAEML